MTDQNVLESLPDRAMKRSEIEKLGEGDSIEWVDVLRTGAREHENMARAWALQADGTVHVLLYEIEGWASQGSFDAEGMTDEEKRERSLEILDS